MSQDFSLETLPQLAQRTNVLIEKGDTATNKAADYYISAGLHLAEAKARVKHGEWGKWCAENISFKATKIHQCLKLSKNGPMDQKYTEEETKAAAEKALAAERKRKKKTMQRHRAAVKKAKRAEAEAAKITPRGGNLRKSPVDKGEIPEPLKPAVDEIDHGEDPCTLVTDFIADHSHVIDNLSYEQQALIVRTLEGMIQ